MKQHARFRNISNSYILSSGEVGDTIAIFGGIHGNETAGIHAIHRLLDEYELGLFYLKKGSIIFAFGNEKAIAQNKHNVGINLNRLFKDSVSTTGEEPYEMKRATELKQILDASTFLLDIHSTSSESPPFVFSESDIRSATYAQYIPVGYRIIGWSEICGDTIGGDTQTYMALRGKMGFTLECGNHCSENAARVAYNSILSFLSHLGYIESPTFPNNTQKVIRMFEIAITPSGKFHFSKKYKCFDIISRGELIGHENGTPFYAKHNSYILLPNYEPLREGNEIFYYGVKENNVS